MVVRKGRRVEIRLDEERGKFLEQEVARRGTSIAGWFRQKVDEERLRLEQEARLAAAERLCALELDLPKDEDELNRLLEEAHCPGPELCDCFESS
jgi:hypothetical protein